MPSRLTVVAGSAALCAVATLLAGCGLGDSTASAGAPAQYDGPGSATSPAPAPTRTATHRPTPASAPAVTPTSLPTPTATATATATAAPTWPKALGEPSQGDPVWAVYLAVGHSAGDAALAQASAQAAGVGYQAVVGDLACDDGAIDALGLDQYDYWSGATLYFATEQQARGFAAAYTAKVAAPKGLAKVNVGCLD